MSDDMEEYVDKFVEAMRSSPDPMLRMAFPDTKECNDEDSETYRRWVDSWQKPIFERAVDSMEELMRQVEDGKKDSK